MLSGGCDFLTCFLSLILTAVVTSASVDNIRLWNVAEANEPDAYGKVRSGVQFKIIPGHHGGFVSQMRE